MIRGELINLRAVERTDASLLHRLFNSVNVISYRARQTAPVSSNEVQRRLEGWLHAEAEHGRPDWLIAETLDGDAIGAISVVEAERRHRALELDLLFDNAGAAPDDALRTIVETCFHHWNLHRVCIRALTGDEDVRILIEAAGFQIDAVLRDAVFLDGRYQDVHLYSRLASDPEPADQELFNDE